MGKASKWLKLLLTGNKKEKEIEPRAGPTEPPPPPPPPARKRWSFRRSATGEGMERRGGGGPMVRRLSDSRMDRGRVAVMLAVKAVKAVEESEKAEEKEKEVIRLTETAAIKIQKVFRAFLARKALCALKGLVKLQALIRGDLVRRQATATLRSIEAMLTAQARARVQRMRMLQEAQAASYQRQKNYHRDSPQEARSRKSYEMEENVKIVEMDLGDSRCSSNSRSSYPFMPVERRDYRLPTYHSSRRDSHRESSPSRSMSTDRSPRATSISSPAYLSTSSRHDSTSSQDYPPFPNYMANTKSSRAKARSHSAPKQRPDSPTSGRRPSLEGRGNLKWGQMNPWSIKLDRSNVSLQESECGSTSTVLTDNRYARSLMS